MICLLLGGGLLLALRDQLLNCVVWPDQPPIGKFGRFETKIASRHADAAVDGWPLIPDSSGKLVRSHGDPLHAGAVWAAGNLPGALGIKRELPVGHRLSAETCRLPKYSGGSNTGSNTGITQRNYPALTTLCLLVLLPAITTRMKVSHAWRKNVKRFLWNDADVGSRLRSLALVTLYIKG